MDNYFVMISDIPLIWKISAIGVFTLVVIWIYYGDTQLSIGKSLFLLFLGWMGYIGLSFLVIGELQHREKTVKVGAFLVLFVIGPLFLLLLERVMDYVEQLFDKSNKKH